MAQRRDGRRENRGVVRAHAGIVGHKAACGLTPAWKEQKSGGNGLDGVAGGEDNYETSGHTSLTFYKANGCVAAELFSPCFFISPSINLL